MDLDSGIREIANAILAFPTAAMLLVAFWLYVTRNRRDWRLGDRDRPGRVFSKGGMASRRAPQGALQPSAKYSPPEVSEHYHAARASGASAMTLATDFVDQLNGWACWFHSIINW